MSARDLITDHLDLWTGAVTFRSTAGRGKNGKIELTGIKKLRELILELAVRGKLVDQDPNDEPASVLLEKIAEEKARLVREGKIKKPKKLPEIAEEDKPFELTDGWAWARIWDISELITSGSRDWAKHYSDYGAIFITMGNLSRGDYKLRLDNIRYVSPPAGGEGARTSLQAGDLVVSITGDVGNLGLIPEGFGEAYINQHSCLVRFSSLCRNRYHAEFFRSPSAKTQFDEPQRGVKNSFRLSDMGEMRIPLPPLQEQHRIVEKVDELMALCDRLEQQVGDQLEAHEVLVDTLLDALTRSADAEELSRSWARVAEHFDTLFTTEASIDKLKQIILQLAVMGRLVEQDPNDESASVLLERIEEAKARLVNKGKIKKPKKPHFPSDQDKIFPLPGGWEWASIASTGITSTGKTPSTKEKHFFDGDIPFIGPGQITAGGEVTQPEKFLSETGLIESEEAVPNDLVVVCIGGSIGKCAKIHTRCGFNQQINKVCPILVHPDYLLSTLSTDFVRQSILEKSTGSATPIINRSKWEAICIPLPPINEQHRIVEKVDELMALCDQLKARLTEAGETRTHLAEAMVDQAVN
ncbi:restriction endonuclease subunit S [Ectothiorhodospira sp. BSL-9]|uniref:restriction endonuclease subunit S n=1 Tax=Ectothiorhodospira sp. BSL-9 TaxID=1442136 RepID=UPI0007B450BB|nr:restriction endonuclease subunit S [Ectothiorhodospira sp. BSL-9]ANB02394.1 hypothetical protein ECTOBSL9_1778 [Ectothiorhodospira sp. BSL-9]